MKKDSIIESPPRTIMEVFKTLPEGTRADLIKNQLYMSPAPRPDHQVVLNDLNFRLMQHFKTEKTGMVFISPLDVYLDENENVVQPDIIVLLNENRHLVREDAIHGVPDILFEILSRGNRDHDTIRKKKLYEQFGVKEYWTIDPDNKLATGFELHHGSYQLIAEDIGIIKSKLLDLSFTF